MKGITKIFKRFFLIFCLIIPVILLLNAGIYFVLIMKDYHTANEAAPVPVLERVSAGLICSEKGVTVPEEDQEYLKEHGIWGMVIDPAGKVIWNSGLPPEIPLQYSLADIAVFAKDHLKDYPVFTQVAGDLLVVLGYPKNSYMKISNYLPVQMVQKVPLAVLMMAAGDFLILFGVYYVTNKRLQRSIKPLVNQIEELPRGKSELIPEIGVLESVARSINEVSEVMQEKDRALKKKETARANWIAGVSHDIRTPLSLIMGYARKLEDAFGPEEKERGWASVIYKNSERIRQLVNDLNLASKLEYNMQPSRLVLLHPVPMLRKIMAEYLNNGVPENYSVDFKFEEIKEEICLDGDADLIYRAIGNLINNAMIHNPRGCAVQVNVFCAESEICIRVTDNGKGITAERYEYLAKTPHYMLCDSNLKTQRHGLGLLIVRQVMEVHHGRMEITKNYDKGFRITLYFPALTLPSGALSKSGITACR